MIKSFLFLFFAGVMITALMLFLKPGMQNSVAREGKVSAGSSISNHENHSHSPNESSEDHDHKAHPDESQDAHVEHDDSGHDNEEVVSLSPEEVEEFEIVVEVASPGSIERFIELPGEIVLNSDRLAHVVPRVPGIAVEVLKSAGENVNKGELLAVIESRELAEARASYLAATEREKIAAANFRREERLWKKRITSEQEYLNARQALTEARISKNSVEQQLHAIGLKEADIRTMTRAHDASGTRFEIRSPICGTIIEKHLTLGESVNVDTNIFTIADLSTVWVDLNVYQKDLGYVHKGQTVIIDAGHGIPEVMGKISWVSPRVDENTRTAKARIILKNIDGKLRPGLFVTGQVAVGQSVAPLVVNSDAIQTFENKTVVFVKTEKGFKPVPVVTGRRFGKKVEILSGLSQGQAYVSKGAFTIKAQLSRGAFGDGHNH